jgi:uncharacterized protein YoxC
MHLTVGADDVSGQLHIHTVDTDRILQALGEVASVVAALQQQVTFLTSQGAQLMAKADDIQAQVATVRSGVAAIGGSLGNITADIERIKQQLSGGLTAAEADAAIAELTSLQTQVNAVATAAANLAASNPEPELPPAEPPVV